MKKRKRKRKKKFNNHVNCHSHARTEQIQMLLADTPCFHTTRTRANIFKRTSAMPTNIDSILRKLFTSTFDLLERIDD